MVDFKQGPRHYCRNTCPAMPFCPPISTGRRKKAPGRGLLRRGLLGFLIALAFFVTYQSPVRAVVLISPPVLVNTIEGCCIGEIPVKIQRAIAVQCVCGITGGEIGFENYWNGRFGLCFASDDGVKNDIHGIGNSCWLGDP